MKNRNEVFAISDKKKFEGKIRRDLFFLEKGLDGKITSKKFAEKG